MGKTMNTYVSSQQDSQCICNP